MARTLRRRRPRQILEENQNGRQHQERDHEQPSHPPALFPAPARKPTVAPNTALAADRRPAFIKPVPALMATVRILKEKYSEPVPQFSDVRQSHLSPTASRTLDRRAGVFNQGLSSPIEWYWNTRRDRARKAQPACVYCVLPLYRFQIRTPDAVAMPNATTFSVVPTHRLRPTSSGTYSVSSGSKAKSTALRCMILESST